MASYKRNKSGGSQSEGTSNSPSPASSVSLPISNPTSSQGTNNNAPKYGTLVPNRIFVGGISSNTTEVELSQLFSKYGNVKATKIIADRAGVSKGYGFVTFDSEEEVKLLFQDANNIVLKERRLNIAPAIKKQIDVFVGQPTSRSFDTSSPPPTTPNLYFHNGVPYTFHNGMAFFPPSAHQPMLAATIPPTDPSMYPPYGPAQNTTHAYGTPVLLPASPIFMPQNYPYQPMPMTNSGPAQIIYPNSGSSNNSGAGSSDNAAIPPHLSTHLYPQQFLPQDAFYPQPVYISYPYNSGDYELQDQQIMADDRSSTLSSPLSERSSSPRSPSTVSVPHQRMARNSDLSRPNSRDSAGTGANNTPPPQAENNSDNKNVPVVSWQSIQDRDERLLYIRDGRRAFHPVIPPPTATPLSAPPMLLYQRPPHSNTVYQQSKQTSEACRNQRQISRGHSRPVASASNIPNIPKFHDFFNNNNPLLMNNNFYDKKLIEQINGNLPKKSVRGRGFGRGTHVSPSNPPNPSLSSPLQMMQQAQFERPMMVNPAPPRWCPNPPNVASHQIKRLVGAKRQNGSTYMNNLGSMRPNKKGGQECLDSDLGGGGDAHSTHQMAASNSDVTSKMQSLALGGVCEV